jgi:hypothetical protein
MLGIPGPTIHPVRSQRQQSAHQSPGSPGDRLSLLQDGELIAPGLCLPVLVSFASLTAGTQSRSRQVSCEGVDRHCVVPPTGWQPPCCLPGPASSARTHSPSASSSSACSLFRGPALQRLTVSVYAGAWLYSRHRDAPLDAAPGPPSRPPTRRRHTRPARRAALPAGLLRLSPASAPSCWVDGLWQHPPHWQASRTVSGSSLCRPHAATSSPAGGAGQQQAARHPRAATRPELSQQVLAAAEAGDPQRLTAGSRRAPHSACPTSPSPSISAAALAAAAVAPARAPLPAATATAAAAAATSSAPGSPQACSGWWES